MSPKPTGSATPPELELILLLTGGDERRAALAERTRDLLRVADYDRLEQLLRARRLLPLIGTRVLAVGGDLVPARFDEAVAEAVAAARARGLALEWSTRRVVATLAAADVPALPLKGPLLAAEVHDDVGLRETVDIDLLAPDDQLDTAVRALQAVGYSAPTDAARRGRLPDLHYRLAHASEPSVELHWRIHWYERAFAPEMLARSSPGADGLLRPRTDDLAASLLLFYARDGLYGLRLPADLAALWDGRREELEGAFLAGHARAYPELAPALTAAAASAERIAGVPALEWLGEAAAKGRGVSISARLANWSQEGDSDQLRANISLVGGLLGPRGSALAFMRRELGLPGAGLGARIAHCVKLTARYLLALWQVRRRARLSST